MAPPRVANVVLQAAVSKTNSFTGAVIDDLDKILRGVVQVVVTALDATSQWQIVIKASVDGVTFFDISRSAAALIDGANIGASPLPETFIFPICSIGDGQEVSATSPKLPFDAAVALAAATVRPGLPWRALRCDLVRTAAGGGTGITYSATLYAVNEQSASQGMG